MLRFKEILIHAGAWLLYSANSVLTYPAEYLERYGVQSIALKQGTFYAVMTVGFYINYFFVTPKLLAKKQYWGFSAAVALLIPLMLGLFLLHALFLDWYFDAGTFFIDDRIPALSTIAFQVLFFLLLSTGARFTRDWFRLQRLSAELKRERENAELALLRQQLSPHFLFNALNNIYSLVINKSEVAPRAIVVLSELMRALLRTVDDNESTLREEITQLTSYLDLKRLQYPDDNRIAFTVDGDIDERKIYPLLLLPFVENAFKHGDLHSHGTTVDIQLRVQPDQLQLIVANTPSAGRKDDTSGIGLHNVQKRLRLLYPNRHKLEISAEQHLYRIDLILKTS
jgi:two-component system, LytTR family, sensor kinase